MLDLLRLWGNDAVHRHMGDGKRAVHALATAHRLAIWFHKVVDGAELSSTQFLVPPDPSNASKELLDSLDEQRQLAAALKTELEHRSGIISSLEDATVYLRRQAKEAWDNARLYESEATSATEQLERERQSSAEQIAAWKRKAAEATPAENVQAFIDRGIRAAERLGVQTGRLDSVPLAQIRVQGPNSPCCKKTTLLVQKSRNSFVVKACCMECDQTWNLSREDFLTLDLWVSCPVCGMRMNPSRPQSYYGYKCDCGVTYLLASLLPCHTEL